MTRATTEVRTGRRVALAALAVVLVGALAWGGWTWRHPDLFAGGLEVSFSPLPLAEAKARPAVGMVGMVEPGDATKVETITFRSIKARFAENSAGAVATFEICAERPGAVGVASAQGRDGLDEACAGLRPVVDGTTFSVVPEESEIPLDQVMMTLTPSAAGTAHVDRITFEYSRDGEHFFQRGSDISEQDWFIQVLP